LVPNASLTLQRTLAAEGHLAEGQFNFLLKFLYLMMLSTLRLYSVNDMMINEYGTVDGMKICRES
jgi:hypothetical protein